MIPQCSDTIWKADVHNELIPIQQKAWIALVQEREREEGLQMSNDENEG